MKRTKADKEKESLAFILENRLEMQSVRRYLDANRVKPNKNFFKSAEFKELYNQWPEYKKKDFLSTLAGPQWKAMQEMIEKE